MKMRRAFTGRVARTPHPSPAGGRSRIGAAWLAFALSITLLGCSPHQAAEEPAAAPTPADSGIVVLEAEAVEKAGIVVAPAGAATIDVILEMPGEVKFDPQRVLEVHPRFPGVVREMRKQVGQNVSRGEVVALIESNESLTNYPVSSSIPGRVIVRTMAPGQAVTQDATLYTIADVSTVWIEFAVYPNDLPRIHPGAPARVTPQGAGSRTEAGTVAYVGPSLDPAARVSVGRVILPNRDGRWEPGLFANVAVTVDHVNAAVAVPDDAIVRTNEGSAVFVADGNRFRKQLVATRRTDGRRTEIVSGLAAGTPVVIRNAFILKSELEKEHEE